MSEWMPVSTTRPPLRAARMAQLVVWLLGRAVDRDIHAALPRVGAGFRAEGSTAPGRSPRSAPMWRGQFAAVGHRAPPPRCGPRPASFRHATVSSPIGPAPKTATVSPGCRSANCIECSATASGSATVARSSDMPAGMPSRFFGGQVDVLAEEARLARRAQEADVARRRCDGRRGSTRSGSSRWRARARRGRRATNRSLPRPVRPPCRPVRGPAPWGYRQGESPTPPSE